MAILHCDTRVLTVIPAYLTRDIFQMRSYGAESQLQHHGDEELPNDVRQRAALWIAGTFPGVWL